MTAIRFYLVVVGVPIVLAALMQIVGERSQWSARQIIGRAVALVWLWYTVAWAVGAQIFDLMGLIITASSVGVLFVLLWVVFSWTGKPIFENYDEYLARKRASRRPR